MAWVRGWPRTVLVPNWGGGGCGVGHEYASRGCSPLLVDTERRKPRLMEALLPISWGFCFVCDLQYNPNIIYPRDSTMKSWPRGQIGGGGGETGRASEQAAESNGAKGQENSGRPGIGQAAELPGQGICRERDGGHGSRSRMGRKGAYRLGGWLLE